MAGKDVLKEARKEMNKEANKEVKTINTKAKKKSFGPAFVIIILILIVAGFLVYNYLSGKVYKSAAGTIGNTAGNLYNSGLFCENGGKIYFSNPNDDYTLYSMDMSLGNVKKLYDDYARFINADENYVFYVRENNKKQNPDKNPFALYMNGVFRIRKNGSNLKMLSKKSSGCLLLYDNKLFYQVSEENNKLTLHRVGIDESDEKTVLTDDSKAVSVFDDRIYYAGTLSDQNIHYINMEGKNSVAVETKAYMPIATKEGIYFISCDNGYNLYLTDFEDKERKCIVDKLVSWYNLTSDGRYIFYNSDMGDDSGMFMLDRNTDETVKILEGNYKWLNIAGNYCFFFDFFNERAYAYDYTARKLSAFDPPVDK